MESSVQAKKKLDGPDEIKINNVLNGISKPATYNLSEYFQNTTEIDLSKRQIEEIDENIALPPSLRSLNLSCNKLLKIPKTVLDLKDLKVLDISHNKIEYFNEIPSFCHTIEYLDISNNNLKCPPIWIWLESATNLSKLDISCNVHIAQLLQEHIDDLVEYRTRLTNVKLYNCKLGKYLGFLSTFQKVKDLELGTLDWSCYSANHLQELPCQGLDKCCDIERLIVTNTYIYTVTPQIKMFKNLIEIDLSQNNLSGIPTEFCELENLEICILSFNNILYVPDEMVKLKKLTVLCLAVNELCMIPQNITELVNLTVLDLYDNHISEFPEGIKKIPELDLAQNYFDEPDDRDYLEKRAKLRIQNLDRLSGRKLEMEKAFSSHSPDTTDEDLMLNVSEDENGARDIRNSGNTEPPNEPPSSPEDWDSDSYWEPHSITYSHPKKNAYWLSSAKKAMDNGNLCPMDKHTIPVMEMVKYEKLCYPKAEYESDGQFDDYSEDDS